MIIEMRTYRLKPGSVAEAEKRFGEDLAAFGRAKVSPLGAFFHTEVGPLNRIIHCWPYESLAAREELRAQAMKTPGWPPPWSPMIITFLKPVMIACSEISVSICPKTSLLRPIVPGSSALARFGE